MTIVKKILLFCLVYLQTGLAFANSTENEEYLMDVKKLSYRQEGEASQVQSKETPALRRERTPHPKLRLSSSPGAVQLPMGYPDSGNGSIEQPDTKSEEAAEENNPAEIIPSPAQELFIKDRKPQFRAKGNSFIQQVNNKDKRLNLNAPFVHSELFDQL